MGENLKSSWNHFHYLSSWDRGLHLDLGSRSFVKMTPMAYLIDIKKLCRLVLISTVGIKHH